MRLAELDAENVRRTHRPRREEARLAGVTDVTDIAAAVRLHHRMVILGAPGSGKTTLGRWLALQFARQMLLQALHEVAPEPAEPGLPETARLHVPAGTTISFSTVHFVPPDQAATTTAIRIDALPERGRLALRGAPVTAGQVIGVKQIGLLTYTPAGNECGSRYACVRFTAGGRTTSQVAGAVVLDVATHVRVPVSRGGPGSPRPGRDRGTCRPWPRAGPNLPAARPFLTRTGRTGPRGRARFSLEEYLGRDPDSCKLKDGCTAESRNALLRAALDDGQTVVILDGLDELNEANRRAVSLQIQKFIKAFIMPNAADGADDAEATWRVGGNQVVVTSRYVGYKLMPDQERLRSLRHPADAAASGRALRPVMVGRGQREAWIRRSRVGSSPTS